MCGPGGASRQNRSVFSSFVVLPRGGLGFSGIPNWYGTSAPLRECQGVSASWGPPKPGSPLEGGAEVLGSHRLRVLQGAGRPSLPGSVAEGGRWHQHHPSVSSIASWWLPTFCGSAPGFGRGLTRGGFGSRPLFSLFSLVHFVRFV